jgi:hypothetical protein
MGGSTEQGNARIFGSIYPSNLPETNVSVHLVPEQYNPYDSSTGPVFKTIADMYGTFTFENVPYGLYYLYAFDNDGSNTLLKGPIEISVDQNNLDRDSLRRSSSVHLSLNGFEENGSELFFIKGTSKTYLNQEDTVIKLENVPSGKQDIIQYDSTLNVVRNFVQSVEIYPEESINVSFNNSPPRITTPLSEFPPLLRIDTTYTILLKASDPESDSVTITALTQGLTNFSFDSHTGTVKWSPSFLDQNLRKITFNVADHRSASSVFTWGFHFNETVFPLPHPPSGDTECVVDTVYTYSADSVQFYSLPVMYRFTLDSGDPSSWSQEKSITYHWSVTGFHKIQVQIGYNNDTSTSEWSKILLVKVCTRSPAPVMLSTKDSITCGSTFIPQFNSACSLFRFHINDSVSPWVEKEMFFFSSQTFGTTSLQISSWCDTAYSLPSEKSAPCTIVVIPPDPILKMEASYSLSDTATIPFSIYLDNMNFSQIEYRIVIYSYNAPHKSIDLGYITIDPEECKNDGLKCTDTLKITNEAESPLFFARSYILHLLSPSGNYEINVCSFINNYKIASRWTTFTINQN